MALQRKLKSQVNIAETSKVQRKYEQAFEHVNQVMLTGGYEKGSIGEVIEYLPGFYLVEMQPERIADGLRVPAKFVKYKPNQVQKISENSIRILSDKENREYQNFEYHPANLVILSNGRRISSTMFNIGTSESPRFVKRNITPNDVFYLDVKVHNTDVQVMSVNSDGTFNGKILVGSTFKIINNIRKDEVEEMYSGFKWLGGVGEHIPAEITETAEDIDLVSEEPIEEPTEEPEEAEEREISGYGDQEEQGQEEEQEQDQEQEQKMVSSFDDLSRMNKIEDILTSDQKTFKSMIISVMTKSGINQNAINPFDLAVIADKLNSNLTKDLNQIVSGTRAINFIIAALVFIQLVQKGYRIIDPELSLTKFFKKLMESNFIKEKDFTEDSILLNEIPRLVQSASDFETQQKIIDTLKRTKQTSKLVEIMFFNAFELVKMKIRSSVEPEITTSFVAQLIPLGSRKRLLALEEPQNIYDISSKYIITVNNLLNDEVLPQKEVRILWGDDLKQLIEKFKAKLHDKYVEEGSMDDDYIFMIDNFERIPFALRELKDAEKHDYYKFIYDLFMNSVKKVLERKLQEKEAERRERERISENRSKIARPMEIDETIVEIPNTSAYMKEQRVRKQKADIARLTRKIKYIKMQ